MLRVERMSERKSRREREETEGREDQGVGVRVSE